MKKHKKKSTPITEAQLAAMTPADRRVAIAKDVLAQTKAGAYKIQFGKYWGWINPKRINKQISFSQRSLKKDASCFVCAAGAAICSGLRLFNGRELNYINEGNGGRSAEVLTRWFSLEQAALIEAAFERSEGSCRINIDGKTPHGGHALSPEEMSRARYFRTNFKTPRQIVIGIFKNIIKNKGEFIPN